jgi:hypothetical protein
MTEGPIPAEAFERIKAFALATNTRSIQLDVKEECMLSWKVSEYGRVSGEPQLRRPYIK